MSMGCSWSCGETVVGWLGLVVCVGRCNWSMLILTVGWLLVGSLMVWWDGVMGEKNILMLVGYLRRRDLEGRVWRVSRGVSPGVAGSGLIGVELLGSWPCQKS